MSKYEFSIPLSAKVRNLIDLTVNLNPSFVDQIAVNTGNARDWLLEKDRNLVLHRDAAHLLIASLYMIRSNIERGEQLTQDFSMVLEQLFQTANWLIFENLESGPDDCAKGINEYSLCSHYLWLQARELALVLATECFETSKVLSDIESKLWLQILSQARLAVVSLHEETAAIEKSLANSK